MAARTSGGTRAAAGEPAPATGGAAGAADASAAGTDSIPGSAPEAQKLELDIFNLQFRLRAPLEEHEGLTRAARHVDQVMRDQVAAQPSADTTRLAIQVAFLIAKDYFRMIDEGVAGGSDVGGVKRRVDDLVAKLEESLALLDAPDVIEPEPYYEEPMAPDADAPPHYDPRDYDANATGWGQETELPPFADADIAEQMSQPASYPPPPPPPAPPRTSRRVGFAPDGD